MVREEIALTVQVQDEFHDVLTYTGEYRNLMSLIFDRIYLEYFSDCRVGRCGTCIVELIKSPKDLSTMDERRRSYRISLYKEIFSKTFLSNTGHNNPARRSNPDNGSDVRLKIFISDFLFR